MLQLLREGEAGGQDGQAGVEILDEVDDGSKEHIVCAACGQHITTRAARLEVGGSSEHTFVNPHYIVFHITTYGAAPGCLSRGLPSTEWSWFPGCSWQVQLCSGCGKHLGWLFRGEEQTFYGLIREHLVDEAGSRPE